jgi:hypothetical protein
MIALMFEKRLCNEGLFYDTFVDSSGNRNYIITYDLPEHNIDNIGIRFMFDGRNVPVMVGFNFYSANDYAMERLVNKANDDTELKCNKDFIFYIENTGIRNEVLVEFRASTKKVALPNGYSMYDYYYDAINDMVCCILNFINKA